MLTAGPRPLSAVVSPGGGTQSLTLDIVNSGTGDGTFVLHEVDVPPPAEPTAKPVLVLSPEQRRAVRQAFTLGPLDARATSPALQRAARRRAAGRGIGNIVTSFPTGFTGGYGLAYDTDSNRLWASNSDAPSAGLTGDGVDYEYLADGTQTGQTIALQPGVWQGDGTYNARTGMIWQVNVAYRVGSGYQCLFEIDPVARVVTGKQICGPWGDFPAQVGLAYDYATDTYYVGDQLGTILHIDNAGNLLDSGHVTLQISGLAYNPTTRHLFVEKLLAAVRRYVVDPSNGYAIRSSGSPSRAMAFRRSTTAASAWRPAATVTSGSYDVFQNVVYEYESGETRLVRQRHPVALGGSDGGHDSGRGRRSVSRGCRQLAARDRDASTPPGCFRVCACGRSSSRPTRPLPIAPVPVDFTVLFNDVPQDSFAWNYIYGAAGAGVMTGCAPQAPLFDFCPPRS